MKKQVEIIKDPARIVLSISDIVTFFNLMCGVLSIFFAINNEFGFAVAFMIFSLVFDFLDGMVARAFGQISRLGAHLDSLADTVSFAIAPTVLVLTLYQQIFMIIPLIIFVITAVFRLARFNYLKNKNLDGYIGMPISWNGILFPIIYFIKPSSIIVAIVLLIVSYLMISKIKFLKRK